MQCTLPSQGGAFHLVRDKIGIHPSCTMHSWSWVLLCLLPAAVCARLPTPSSHLMEVPNSCHLTWVWAQSILAALLPWLLIGLGGLRTECEDARRESPGALDGAFTTFLCTWRAQTALHRVRLILLVLATNKQINKHRAK